MRRQGLVSIVVPVYNAAPYLEETVRAVQRQTFENWELLLVDDRSADESGEIMRRLAAQDGRPQSGDRPGAGSVPGLSGRGRRLEGGQAGKGAGLSAGEGRGLRFLRLRVRG